MDRTQNWYSIIQYMPNKLRGEIINIGALLHNPDNGTLKYQILEETNTKVKALLGNEISNNTYRLKLDFVKHFLENLPSEDTLFEKSKFNNCFLEDIKDHLPEGFILSDPAFSKTSSPDTFFEQLLINYIGKEFLKLGKENFQVTTKKYVNNYFDEKKLIGTKVKPNAKIQPISKLNSMHYIIDFVYKNGVINLMQTAPTNRDRLNEWFSKVNTISKSYDKDAGIYLMYNQNDSIDSDNTLTDMLNYFVSNDQRIKKLDVTSRDFIKLGNKIEQEGQYLKDFEKELA